MSCFPRDRRAHQPPTLPSPTKGEGKNGTPSRLVPSPLVGEG